MIKSQRFETVGREILAGLDAPCRPMHGVVLCAITAGLSEILLRAFFSPDEYFSSVARISFLFLTLYVTHRFALVSLERYRPSVKDLIFLHVVIVGSVSLVWLHRILAVGLAASSETIHFLGRLNADSLYYAIPFAAGGLLLQAVLWLHFGLVFAVSFALVVGVYFPDDTLLVPYVLISNLVACLSLSHFRSRSAYLKAGFNIAVICFPFALASVVIDDKVLPTDMAMRLFGALMSGALCSFIAAGVTPIVEFLGGYVTDMRLLEMATLDHPLLKEMSIHAPGTWNHSMVMGMMVESAASAIGANPVLTRVGAYFHDIGKTKKPLYFVENQGGGENRHDKLSTSMSALIIRSHVKDGIELARKHSIPRAVEDMIPQHHGTSLIEYFYDKARKEAEEAGGNPDEVDRSLYSYPGPKPQTREAGLLMLADGIEAATRTLSEPNHDRIQGLVQKLINKVFASGELDECELTLKDLHLIAKCFTRVLTGIYHQRIAYAEPAEKGSEKEIEETGEFPAVASGDPVGSEFEEKRRKKLKKKKPGEDKGDKEDDKENLKRLGL